MTIYDAHALVQDSQKLSFLDGSGRFGSAEKLMKQLRKPQGKEKFVFVSNFLQNLGNECINKS